jgi:RNA polymerase sigma factor (sigma-70 family)
MREYLTSDDFLRDFARGDRKAFGALFDVYFPRLTVFGQKLTRDYQVAEDASSEALTRLMLDYRKWRHGTFTEQQLGAYLFTAVRHKCLDFLRSFRKKTSPTSDDVSEALGGEPVDSVEEAMIFAELVAKLFDGLNDLSKEQRQALELIFYQGKSYEEAAREMGVPLSTFKYIRKGGLTAISKKLTRKELATGLAVMITWFANH